MREGSLLRKQAPPVGLLSLQVDLMQRTRRLIYQGEMQLNRQRQVFAAMLVRI
jgi:hypothetical protein